MGARNGWRALARDLILLAAAGGLIYTGIEWGSARQTLRGVEHTVNEHIVDQRSMAELIGRMDNRLTVLESRLTDLERRLERLEQRGGSKP